MFYSYWVEAKIIFDFSQFAITDICSHGSEIPFWKMLSPKMDSVHNFSQGEIKIENNSEFSTVPTQSGRWVGWYWYTTVADLHSEILDVPPPGPKFFQFHTVFGKIWQNHMLVPPPPEGWCPHLGEILDPPVHKSCHANSKEHATAQHEIHASCNVPLTVLITCNVGHLYYLLK